MSDLHTAWLVAGWGWTAAAVLTGGWILDALITRRIEQRLRRRGAVLRDLDA